MENEQVFLVTLVVEADDGDRVHEFVFSNQAKAERFVKQAECVDHDIEAKYVDIPEWDGVYNS